MDLNDPRIKTIAKAIETYRRRKILDYKTIHEISFIDPYQNITRISSYNNHVLFGRRGSGKTTLLLKSVKEEEKKHSNILVFDGQLFRDKSSTEIVLTIIYSIIDTFNSFAKRKSPKIKYYFFQIPYYLYILLRPIMGKLRPIAFYVENYKNLTNLCNYFLSNKDRLFALPKEFTVKKTTSRTSKVNNKTNKAAKFSISNSIELSNSVNLLSTEVIANITSASNIIFSHEEIRETTEEETKNINYNDEHVTSISIIRKYLTAISFLTNSFTNLTSKNTIIYIDDFYLIQSEIQPYVIQFLHDVYKNTPTGNFCFKLTTLPNRFRINIGSQKDFTTKDDFSPIKLDNELSDLENQIDYLISIISSIGNSSSVSNSEFKSLFVDDIALKYATLAAGGIPRDFLVLLNDLISKALAEARNTISKENVYAVVRDLKADKEQNIQFDSELPDSIINEALAEIQSKIISEEKTNVFLFQEPLNEKQALLLRNLINLRYLHLIKENFSTPAHGGILFTAYFIDMTFYATGLRMPRNFNFCEFWVRDETHHLAALRKAPAWSFSEQLINKINIG